MDNQFAENLHYISNNFSFKRMKTEKVEKLSANLYNKTEHVIHEMNSKQPLNHGLVLKNLHKIFKFIQKDWLKSILISTQIKDLRKKSKI